jgi:hypothetical protein
MLVHEYLHVQRGCVHVCKRVAHTYLSLYNAYHTDMLQYYACVCRYTHTEAFWHMRIQNQMYRTWMIYASIPKCVCLYTRRNNSSRLSAHDSLDEHDVCMRFTHDDRNMILFRYMLCISYT